MSSSAASSSDGDDIPATADPSDKGSDSEVEINDEDDDGGSVEVEGEEEGEEEDDDGEREEEGDDGEGEGGEGEGEGEGEREGEEEDGEEEAEDDDGEDKAIDLLDSPVAAYEGQKDSSQEIESDGHDEHLRSGSSAPEKSELNVPADACDKEDNGFPESAVDNKDTEALPEEKAPDVQKDHHEAHNGSEAHLNNSDSMDAHNTRSSSVNEKVVAAEALMGNGSSHKGSNSVIHSESKQMEMQEGEDLNMRASSLPTPQQRPRSLSPGADYEDRNKRPAIVCDFFARGWCIKGSSCRFLHRKDGMEKGDVAVTNWKSKLQVDAGLRQGTETSRLSTFPEPLASSVAINSSFMSHLPSGSFLSLEHGESHRLHQFHQEHRPPSLQRGDPSSAILQDKSGPTSIIPRDFQQLSSTGDDRRPIFSFKDVGRENLRQNLCLDDFSRHASSVIQGNFSKLDTHGRGWPANNFEKWTSSIQEEYSQKPLSDLMGNKLSVTEEFMSGSPLARSDFVPNYRFLSSGSIASSSIYKSSSNPSVYNKSVEEQASLKSNSNTSLPSIGLSPSRHTLVWSGGSSSHVSSSLSALDGDRGYHGSRSTSLPRSSSSPFYSRSEPENLPLHSVPRDSLASAGQKTQSNVNAWEPSLPFRPSFHFASGSISSPGSQYDPLVDSIDPPNGGDRSFRASSFGQGATIQLTSHQQTNGDPVLTGTCGPEYNADKNSLSFNQQSRGNAMEKNIVIHGVGLCMPAGETTGTCVDDHENKGSTAKDEKPLDPGDFVDVAKANEMGLDHNSRHQRDRARHKKEPEEGGGRYNSEMDLHRKFRHQKDGEGHNKESKALKLFRADLVDFVKELVKPHWREGHLSKDAHKTVVRKAVDKVLSALQPSQVPSTSESINQYLSSSRAKIARLVEGYVDKYAKSSAASG